MNTIKPIKNKADYDMALARIEMLWGAEPDTPESDELEVLFTLVEAYEQKNYPIAPPNPVDAIKFEMEIRGFSRLDLEPYIGSRGRVSDILNHKRNLSIEMIRKLHHGLNIPLESLIGV